MTNKRENNVEWINVQPSQVPTAKRDRMVLEVMAYTLIGGITGTTEWLFQEGTQYYSDTGSEVSEKLYRMVPK